MITDITAFYENIPSSLPVSYISCASEHVDNLGAYSASRPETGLLIPSDYARVLIFLALEGPVMELDGCVGKVVERILLMHEVGPQTIEVLFKDGTTLRLSLAQRVGIEVWLDDGKRGDGSVPKKYPTAA